MRDRSKKKSGMGQQEASKAIPHPPRNRGFAAVRDGCGYGLRSDSSCLLARDRIQNDILVMERILPNGRLDPPAVHLPYLELDREKCIRRGVEY